MHSRCIIFRVFMHEAAVFGDSGDESLIARIYVNILSVKSCILAHCTAPAPQKLGEQSLTLYSLIRRPSGRHVGCFRIVSAHVGRLCRP